MVNRRSVLLSAGALVAAPTAGVTVLYDGKATQMANAQITQGDLWIDAKDLPKFNGFEVKPQGACRGDICIPLSKDLKDKRLFNLTGFARKMKQAFVHEGDLWSFGELPVLRTGFLESRMAPSFTVRDRKGQDVRLEDFRGRKILLLTWASW